MKYIRPLSALAMAGTAALLSGCIVAPLGRPVAYYPARPVYYEPAPVVVVPAPYFGYYGYGYRGYRHWR
jgi:hypothetical protein